MYRWLDHNELSVIEDNTFNGVPNLQTLKRYKFIVIGLDIVCCQTRKQIEYTTPKIDSDCPFDIFKHF
jgi:hypothetical protein